MDPLKSSEEEADMKPDTKPACAEIQLPKRGLTVEFLVGVFTMIGVAAIGYQAVGLGGMEFGNSNKYDIHAEFDNVSGLKEGAAVEIAGVPIGEVSAITLQDPEAIITLRIDKSVVIHDDDIAAVRTKGIIGDRYVKISRGASEDLIQEGGTMFETESVVDIEDIIGKIVHSLSGDDDDETPKEVDEESQ